LQAQQTLGVFRVINITTYPMRPLLCITALLWLLAARPACAQTDSLASVSRARAGSLQARPLAAEVPVPDTAMALHRFFARHRARRRGAALGTLLVGTTLTSIPAVSVKRSNDPLDAGFNIMGAVLAGTLTATLVPLELLHHNPYTLRYEQQAIALWRAHQLPAELRQRLKPKYFVARKL